MLLGLRGPVFPLPDGTWKNFITDFGAVGDGVTDDSGAITGWQTYARAQGSTPTKLFMPPKNYHIGGENGLTDGLINSTIYGVGASVDNLYIGSRNLLNNDAAHQALIAQANAGDSAVTLLIGADASKFTVGRWILISGLALQNFGYPPNWQYNEYRKISGISGSVVSLTEPLTFTYLTTWPAVNDLGFEGGPATIWALSSAFECNHLYFGLTCTADGVATAGGLNTTLASMAFTGQGPGPSLARNYVFSRCAFGRHNEVDKCVTNLTYNNCSGDQIQCQSTSVINLFIRNSTVNVLNGCAQNVTIENSAITSSFIGSGGNGQVNSVVAKNSSFGSAASSNSFLQASDYTFSGGIFTVPNASAALTWQGAVPGWKYTFAFFGGGIVRTDDLGHMTDFTITGMTQDATNTYVHTDIVGAKPTPTFLGGQACNAYAPYGAKTITQTNCTGADLTGFVQP